MTKNNMRKRGVSLVEILLAQVMAISIIVGMISVFNATQKAQIEARMAEEAETAESLAIGSEMEAAEISKEAPAPVTLGAPTAIIVTANEVKPAPKPAQPAPVAVQPDLDIAPITPAKAETSSTPIGAILGAFAALSIAGLAVFARIKQIDAITRRLQNEEPSEFMVRMIREMKEAANMLGSDAAERALLSLAESHGKVVALGGRHEDMTYAKAITMTAKLHARVMGPIESQGRPDEIISQTAKIEKIFEEMIPEKDQGKRLDLAKA